MTTATQFVDLDELTRDPNALRALIEDVQRTRQPRVIRSGGQDVAVLRPAAPHPRRRRDRRTSDDDPMWSVVGIGASEGPGDLSVNKYKYLADIKRSTYQ